MEPATPDLEAEGDLGAHSVLVQKNCFMRWVNKHLKTVNKHIADLATDLSDGLRLIALVEVLSGKRIRSYNRRPNTRIHQLDNVNIALKFLKDNEGIKIVNIRNFISFSDVTTWLYNLESCLEFQLHFHPRYRLKLTEYNVTYVMYITNIIIIIYSLKII